MAITLVIADDHALLREGLKRIFELEPDLEVVGQAADGAEAIELVRQKQPQVVLLDVSMPKMNGIEAATVIHQEFPHVGIIALTIHEDSQYMLEMIGVGVQGYLLKDSEPSLIIDAIRTVAAGGAYLSPAMLARLVQATRQLLQSTKIFSGGVDIQSQKELENLAPREREILALVAQGKTNREIAQIIFISPKTVKNHVTNIIRKLGVTDRTQAAMLALRSGWFSEPAPPTEEKE